MCWGIRAGGELEQREEVWLQDDSSGETGNAPSIWQQGKVSCLSQEFQDFHRSALSSAWFSRLLAQSKKSCLIWTQILLYHCCPRLSEAMGQVDALLSGSQVPNFHFHPCMEPKLLLFSLPSFSDSGISPGQGWRTDCVKLLPSLWSSFQDPAVGQAWVVGENTLSIQ